MRVNYDQSLDMLKLPARKQNALEELGIFTWGDLLHRLLSDSQAVARIFRGKVEWWEDCEWLNKKMYTDLDPVYVVRQRAFMRLEA